MTNVPKNNSPSPPLNISRGALLGIFSLHWYGGRFD